MKVKFLGKHGYDHEIMEAKAKGLIESAIYEVGSVEVGTWKTYYIMKNTGEKFNSAMFEEFDEIDEIVERLDETGFCVCDCDFSECQYNYQCKKHIKEFIKRT